MITASVKTTDNRAKIMESFKSLQSMQVYVGVPEADNTRKSGEVGNAELLFIHTNGSPIRHIPARPVLEPAIKARGNIEPIQDELKSAATAALSGDKKGAIRYFNRAGLIGQNVCRAWFTDPRNGWAPNSTITVMRKMSKLKGAKYTAAKAAVDSGESLEGINTPLIDTAQLRKAITYVVSSND